MTIQPGVIPGDQQHPSLIIAVINEKGGVAKTTTVLSLGGALVEAGQDVLLIDLDAQANLTMGLGVYPAKIQNAISDVLLNSVTLDSVMHTTNLPGLDLVPSNNGMLMAERFLSVRQDYEHVLANAIKNVQELHGYQYILIDCPPSLGAVTINALAAANLAIIPTQPEYFSINGLRGVLTAIRGLRSSGNPTINYRVLITMMDRRNRIHHTLSEQLRTTFKDGVLNTVIEVDTRLRESTVAGLPVTHYSPRSRSSIQYRSLAQELIWSEANVQENITQPA
jgi:chromosome partitioning protein